LESLENKQRVLDIISVFFQQYAQQIQFNVVDGEIYKKAMKTPDQYRDLMVRVSGYSALFTSLMPEVQMDVINRTELRL
jgi:formate C-acetyltransferase